MPEAISRSSSPCVVTSMTANSVTIVFTTPSPVRGRLQRFKILGRPSFVACSMATITRRAPATRSMLPPIPFTTLPGIIQQSGEGDGRQHGPGGGHPLHHFAGNHPTGEVAFLVDF